MINKSRMNKKRIAALLIAMLFLLFSTAFALATVDLVSPENNSYANHYNITFDYYVSLDNITECKLIVDSSIVNTSTNISNPGFNSLAAHLTLESHVWSVTCNYANGSENSEERTILADPIEPTIVLFFPLNNATLNTPDLNISFVALDNIAENISCDIFLDSALNKSIIAKNSEPTSTTITGLSNGNHTWSISCKDYANNTETSETRTAMVNVSSSPPEFSITIPKTEYNTGENALMSINAPNGTSIRVEVCPNQAGFVECKVPVNAQNIMNYPFQEYLPYTNYEGTYLLEAFFNYSGTMETQSLGYAVQNNMRISIDTDENQRRSVPVLLDTRATGGVGNLNYSWHLSNGSIVNDNEANITYAVSGNYTNTVVVKDAYNNTKNKSITLIVENTYAVTVVVKDAITNALLQGAVAEIDEEQKETGSTGAVNYYLKAGRREIQVLRENYSLYTGELNITKDETFTILLQPEGSTEPTVTLLRPGNNSIITGPTTNLVFKAEHSLALNCSSYISESNDGFFMYLGSTSVSSSAEQPFGIMDLENKTYWWKVECADASGKRGMSKAWKFTVGGTVAATPALTAQQSSEAAIYDNWVKELQQIQDDFENMPADQRAAATTLGLVPKVEKSITMFKNTIRDIDALKYRNDLTELEKQAEAENLVQKAQEAYQQTPISIEILNSEEFVDYIQQPELEGLLDEYLSIENSTAELSKKDLLKVLDELQQEVVISTKAMNARVKYRDGTQSDASIIFREVKTYNITDSAFILESIPKDVAEKADDISSSQEFKVIKQDPIIRFELKGDTTIAYYFQGNVDLEQLKKIKTAVFAEPSTLKVNEQITGFSIKSLKLPKIKGIIFIPIIIILLGGLVFAGVKYDGINTTRYLLYRLSGKKSLHYLNIILNEIHDNLGVGEFEKAVSLYDEARDAYSELSGFAKNDVYEKVTEAADKIQEYNSALESQNGINEITAMMNNINSLLSNGDLIPALEEYKRIEHAYNQLGDDVKELLHPALVSLGNQIQILIDNIK